MDTFKTIPDLIKDPKQDYTEFVPKLNPITKILRLDNDYQTYLLGLYLKYLVEITGMRKDAGGSQISTFAQQLSVEALKGSWEWMSTEFPPILYGFFMYDEEKDKKCEAKIINLIRFLEDKQIALLCKDPLLNFENPESYAFYATILMTKSQKKIDYLVKTSQISQNSLDTILNSDTYIEKKLFNAMAKVYKNYGTTICKRSQGIYCSNNELAFAQWLSGEVTKNPIKPLQKANSIAEMFNLSHYSPELYLFYEKMGMKLPETLDIEQVWNMITDHYLTNLRVMSDLYLGVEDKEYDKYKILNADFLKYVKYIAIEEGFNGF